MLQDKKQQKYILMLVIDTCISSTIHWIQFRIPHIFIYLWASGIKHSCYILVLSIFQTVLLSFLHILIGLLSFSILKLPGEFLYFCYLQPRGQCVPLPAFTSSAPASLLSLALSLGPTYLWLPWWAPQCSPPSRLFKISSRLPLPFSLFPRPGLLRPSVEWQENGELCSVEGNVTLQLSTLCCCKPLGKWAAPTCFCMHFQTLVFQWKYSQWDFFSI